MLFVGAYSLGAYTSPRRAVAGLVVTATVMAEIGDKGGLLAFSPHRGGVGVALSLFQLLTFWLAGVLVRAHGQAASLAASVRAAGLPVNLVISGHHAALPAAADVSVYRIVQESLTNVLKHAGQARADVTIGCAEEAVTIEITDNGTEALGNQTPAGGHGLAGMRERAAVFGGGFAVRARLPLGDGLPAGEPW